ncbi:MAG TPA: nucleotide exchange factor GrpE [Xanthobacteraceae bacterium]|nr:nucleotide exchange factor GrpE [Xanthobacteraceae bacterium]
MSQRVAEGQTQPSDNRTEAGNLRAESESLRDRMLRALAEAENTRRRAERAQDEARRYAVADFARELLPVVDNLRRTIAAGARRAPQAVEDAALVDGVRAIERLLVSVFQEFGIRPIEAQGAPFDPSLHEAIMEEFSDAQVPGSVARVLEEGYTLHDRLLRPARVSVAKQYPAAASAERDQGGPRGPRSSDHGS